ncbi:LysR family transcriptional regulator [Thermoanaerobacterium thermosaccharolyticum]|jgi:DNA-binding transcriptional LysR family regulator|uniref:LysR family transcriptional regulator n=1 Tax=Thermoanaerobacterium thermosaccharolyticum TaxID=1517 RepID=UPI003DA8C028
MNNIQIEYFIELCKTLNFTKTALNLYVSQPAVSKQINSLEKEIGFQLFYRNNKNVSLTPAGKLFYDYFLKAINDYQKTVKEAQNLIEKEKKPIVIGFLASWDFSEYLPYITKSFLLNYPDVSIYFVSYSYKDLKDKIETNDVDIAISLLDNFENLNVTVKEFTSIPRLLFFSKNHPLANKSNLTFEDFKEETFFVFSDKSKINSKDRVIEMCSCHGFIPKISIVPNIESMILNVEGNLGVAIFDDWIQYKNNPTLKFIETGDTHKIAIAWNNANLNDLVDFLIHEFIDAVSKEKQI